MSDDNEKENETAGGGYNTEADDFASGGGTQNYSYSEYSDPSLGQVDLTHKNGASGAIKKAAGIILCAAAAVFAAVYIAGIVTLPKNTVMRNVYLDDIRLGGMTYDEALKAINDEYMMNDADITVTCGGSESTFRGSDIGMAANVENTAHRAFDYGKDGNFLVNGFKNAVCLFKKHTVEPAANIDRELLTGKINEFGIQLYGKLAEHTVGINRSDSTADVYPGHTGYNPESPESYTEAVETVLASIARNKYDDIAVSLSAVQPSEMTLDKLKAAVCCDPSDAKYVINGNDVTVEPEIDGRYLDDAEAGAYLINVVEGGEPVKIPYYTTPAEVTSEQLSEKLFADTLGSYSTSYGGSTSNRAANVARAAELINGKVLAPGDTFSFNDTVGLRTKDNGFYSATEYVNGESVEGIGGGTCQVSTTLYSAVLYADLQIVHRECHMMSVGYVPLGQDATVADNSVDFQFKNTTSYPIKISSYTEGRTIYVSIIGTAWDPPRTVELKHSVSSSGENTIVQSTRYVYENGELISTDTLGQSFYRPHKQQSTQ